MANEIIKDEEKKTTSELLIDDLKPIIDQSKTFEQQAHDVATVIAAKGALQDETLIKDLTDAKKKEFKTVADANYKKGQAINQAAEKKLQKTNFDIYEGLADYMGLKKDLPNRMLKVLMFFAQILLGFALLIRGLVVGVVNIYLEGLDSIMINIAELAKTTQKIAKYMFWIILILIILVVIYYLLKQFLGIDLREIFRN